jgi:hypothetical protein
MLLATKHLSRTRSGAMDEPIPCPQCGAPAQITERFWLDSTDGPVKHLKTGCVNHHWLTPLAETAPSAKPELTPAAAMAAPA